MKKEIRELRMRELDSHWPSNFLILTLIIYDVGQWLSYAHAQCNNSLTTSPLYLGPRFNIKLYKRKK